MDALREMARSLVILATVALGLEMALPQGAMRPYVRAVVGLLAMLVILDPVLTLARRPVAVDPAGPLDPGWTRFPTLAEIEAASRRLRQQNEGLIARQFGEQVRQAAEAAARAVPGVTWARAEVHLGPPDSPLGPPQVALVRVEIRTDGSPPAGKAPGSPAHAVQQAVSDRLGLPAARVVVTVREGAPRAGRS